jgi:UDP-N-acetyl-alpha-D-muramoyl-L-alanyl-L-glutamate epimerase
MELHHAGIWLSAPQPRYCAETESEDLLVLSTSFRINAPQFDAASGVARFTYGLDELAFAETLHFPPGASASATQSGAFLKLLDLTAIVLGVSYFKLKAPLRIETPISLTERECEFAIDVYSNGLGEFYARNNLDHFGRIEIVAPNDRRQGRPAPLLKDRALLPIGGGKDSLVSLELMEAAGLELTPFAVNPKGPILSSVAASGRTPLYVERVLDAEMIRLSTQPGYYNGHVPSTAIISMIASLTALLFSYARIVLSNERSASEGNTIFAGREVNHQHSKSLDFERRIAVVLGDATGGALGYFSLLRPYSEARIASLFARETRFDHVFSSCNRNFKLSGHDGPLWCGECPKCHFTFLIMAPRMNYERMMGIFGHNFLDRIENERSFRELTGLAGQKPWECVGEIEEAAACLYVLTEHQDWEDAAVVKALHDDLIAQYGRPRLSAALAALFQDSADHNIPPGIVEKVAQHAA